MRSKRVTGDGSLGIRNAKSTRNAPPHLAAAVALALGWCLVSGLPLSRSVSQCLGGSAILPLFVSLIGVAAVEEKWKIKYNSTGVGISGF